MCSSEQNIIPVPNELKFLRQICWRILNTRSFKIFICWTHQNLLSNCYVLAFSISKAHNTTLIKNENRLVSNIESLSERLLCKSLQSAFFTLISHLEMIDLYTLVLRMRLGYWGLSKYVQKAVLFLPFFEERGFEVFSISDSLSLVGIDLNWCQPSEENPRQAVHFASECWAEMFWLLTWYRSLGSHEALGQPVCLLRHKRICFPCTRDIDSTLFPFTHEGRQLRGWNLSLYHREL